MPHKESELSARSDAPQKEILEKHIRIDVRQGRGRDVRMDGEQN